MDKNSVFGEVLEKGQNAVGNTASNVATNTVSDLSQTVAEQLGIKPKSQTYQGQVPQVSVSDNIDLGAQSSEATKEIVEDFYSPSDITSNNTSESSNPQFQIQEKLAKVRRELLQQHNTEYYDPLIAYEQKRPEPTKADVIEQEEAQKMQALALEQQQGSSDIATTRAQNAVESNRGVAG